MHNNFFPIDTYLLSMCFELVAWQQQFRSLKLVRDSDLNVIKLIKYNSHKKMDKVRLKF